MNTAMTYLENSVMTESPGRIIVLLYDGAILALRRAAEAIENRDWQTKSRCLSRARDILWELNQSLNLEAGGSLAQNLRCLYNFLQRCIGEINISNDLVRLEKAIGILEDLGGAWKKVAG
jgi:flagellar protein FliS